MFMVPERDSQTKRLIMSLDSWLHESVELGQTHTSPFLNHFDNRAGNQNGQRSQSCVDLTVITL